MYAVRVYGILFEVTYVMYGMYYVKCIYTIYKKLNEKIFF